MLTGRSSLFSFVVLSCLSSTFAAVNDTTIPPTTAPPTTAPPQNAAGVPATGCAALCTQAKLQDGAAWYGQNEVHVYCRHPEFIKAFNNCLRDNCKPDELESAKQVGQTLCAGVQPLPTNPGGPSNNGTGNVPVDPNNPAAARPPLSGPANAPVPADANLSANGAKAGTNPASPATSPTGNTGNGTLNTSGALNGTLTSPTSANNASSATNRFSGAVGSAAANASAQGNSASGISPSTALGLSATSFLLSIIL